VTQIALWRYHDRLGYDTIADRLNADPTKYPPPIPSGKTRARGARGKTSVYEVLRNPKIHRTPKCSTDAHPARDVAKSTTRSNGSGRPNQPTSRCLKWMYDQLNAQRKARRGSRDDNQPNRHPQTRRTYLLRGMLFCPCGRRMYGNQRHHAAYYSCWPKNNMAARS
jgi:site-specific DNA recombinase